MRETDIATYPLSVDLANVRQTLGDGIRGHLIPKLVSEVGSFGLCPCCECSCVGDRSCDDAADCLGDLEDVGDGGGVHELVLCLVLVRVHRREGFPRHTGTFFCDKTTAQSLPRMPTDMMLAAVMALKAYSIDGR